jgi:Ala-tRNA(Pro) deacylase
LKIFDVVIQVEEFLKSNSIDYVLHEHAPVFTAEEVEKLNIPGLAAKNLFLRDQKSTRILLVILPAAKKTDLKKLGKLTGAGKLSFVNAETLYSKLGVEPGAVSPFGLLNNKESDVEVFIDREITSASIVQFHPNHNNATLQLTSEMFTRYLSLIRNKITVMNNL